MKSKKQLLTHTIHIELFGDMGKKWKKYTAERGAQAMIIRRAVRQHIKAVEKMQDGGR